VVVNTTSTAIVLSWQPPPIEDQNGAITGYVLNVTLLETGETEEVLTGSTNYTLDPVMPNTLYTAAVAALTSAGRGPFSATVSAHTLEDGNMVIFIAIFLLMYALSMCVSSHSQNQMPHLRISATLQSILHLWTFPGPHHQLKITMESSDTTLLGWL